MIYSVSRVKREQAKCEGYMGIKKIYYIPLATRSERRKTLNAALSKLIHSIEGFVSRLTISWAKAQGMNMEPVHDLIRAHPNDINPPLEFIVKIYKLIFNTQYLISETNLYKSGVSHNTSPYYFLAKNALLKNTYFEYVLNTYPEKSVTYVEWAIIQPNINQLQKNNKDVVLSPSINQGIS
jgi:hypothetical protein